MKIPALLSVALFNLSGAVLDTPALIAAPTVKQRQQQVRPLPGGLDKVLMVNDNNPELITGEGILISTFPTKNTQSSSAKADKSNLAVPLDGRFDLFSHHVYAGLPDHLESTLWLAVLAQPLGEEPVQLTLLKGSTSLSQATEAGQTAAPFLPLPKVIAETTTPIAAGPGSRVAGDLLRGERAQELPERWELLPGSPSALLVLPIPVAGLDPLLNGRNIRVSDNTATNLLIQRIGGKDVLNARFNALGLSSTVVNNWLPDLQGTNTTSSHDLARAIALVDTGKALSPRTRDLFREAMSTSVSNRLLPGGFLKGLGGKQGEPDNSLLAKGYRIYNKTGDIGIAYADAGLIELPDGSRAVAGFMVKGPFNDPRSTELIRDMAAAMAPVLKPKPSTPRTESTKSNQP